jgi:hypothetical protein
MGQAHRYDRGNPAGSTKHSEVGARGGEGWIPVPLARARLALQIRRMLNPSSSRSASFTESNPLARQIAKPVALAMKATTLDLLRVAKQMRSGYGDDSE